MARQRSALLLLALLGLAAAPSAAQTAQLADLLSASGIQPIAPPVAAPDFTLPLLGGGEGDLSANQGDWVVLTFFATWCGPCRSEMPTLERLHRDRGEAGLAVLAVSVDRQREVIAPFVDQLGLTLPVYWDDGGRAGEAYRATSIPVSYLIDPSGRLVGMARGARDWAATAPLFDALLALPPAESGGVSHYAQLDRFELPEVLEPPTADWSLPAEAPRPGRPFILEVRLAWSGRLEDYLPQPPQIALPEGLRRGRVAASSSSLDRGHLVRYQIELTASEPGIYELEEIELRYLPALGDGPAATRVPGPTLEVAAAGLGGAAPAALAALAAAAALTGLWLYRRRHRQGEPAAEPPPWERLRADLDRAKRHRMAGDPGAAYETLVAAARDLEADDERQDLERRLESVRFGGAAPDGAELEAIERRLERALDRRRPDPDAAHRRRLRLAPDQDSPSPLTRKETTG